MPIYEFHCVDCDNTLEIFQHKMRPRKKVKCSKCGNMMRRIISRVNTDLKENIRFSNAMGVNIRQIPEAMRLYPDSEYDNKGRLKIYSRKDKLKKMKQRGVTEFD